MIDENIGFCVEGVEIKLIGEFIKNMVNEPIILNGLKKNSLDFVSSNYNSKITGEGYLKTFLRFKTKSIKTSKYIVYKQFGILDHMFIPNTLTRILKRIKNVIS